MTRASLPILARIPWPILISISISQRRATTGLPREIEIWFTQIGDTFYVIAEYETSQWLRNLRANPEVHVRVAELSFAGSARIVSPQHDPDLHRRIQDLSRDKYGWGNGLVVELKPRD